MAPDQRPPTVKDEPDEGRQGAHRLERHQENPEDAEAGHDVEGTLQ